MLLKTADDRDELTPIMMRMCRRSEMYNLRFPQLTISKEKREQTGWLQERKKQLEWHSCEMTVRDEHNKNAAYYI